MDWLLEEVVVTAQKREERLLDVPISIAVVDESTLEDAGISNLGDLSYLVPNLSVVEQSSGIQQILLRGIGNGVGSSPLVGIYLDETPVSIAHVIKINIQALDLDRVEVLRGPQGTLYGQGAVGGTVKFISNAPSFESLSGEVGIAAFNTTSGGESSEYKAIANIPVIDEVLAFRIAASYKDHGGWIDKPESEDANDVEQSNIHLKGLWNISENLTMNASANLFESDAGASNQTNIGDVKESRYRSTIRNSEEYPSTNIHNEYDIYNVTLEYDFDDVKFTSSSSYIEAQYEQDSTSFSTQFLFNPTVDHDILFLDEVVELESYSQEFRFSGASERWAWTAGTFYADSKETVFQGSFNIYSEGDLAFPVNPNGSETYETSKSVAIFGDATYDVGENISASIGLRHFTDKREFGRGISKQSEEFESTTPKLAITYALSDQSSMYVSISEGFRSGGFNSGSDVSFDPESVRSFEIGAKAMLFDRSLRLEAAVFHSKYFDYQEADFNADTGTLIRNPGEAETEGLEWSSQWILSPNFNLGFSGNVTESEFTKASQNPAVVREGDPLNLVPKYSLSLFANLDFMWLKDVAGSANVVYSRQGPSSFTNRAQGIVNEEDESESINVLNAQLSARWDSVDIKIFAKNIGNESRATSANLFNNYTQLRPRSVGLDLSYNF